IVDEAADTPVVERIAAVGDAIVAQVPDRGDPALAGALQRLVEEGEVVAAAPRIHKRPGDTLASDADAQVFQESIVLLQVAVMSGEGDVVLTLSIFPEKSGALEAGHEEGGEEAVGPGVGVMSDRHRNAGHRV